MVFAKFDDAGFPIGFYTEEIHGDTIPAGSIEISEAQWKDFLDNAGLRRWENGGIVEIDPPAPAVPDPITIVNNVDLWSRMTDDEADLVGAAMEEQPFRVRKIFESASTFRSDHELWPLLVQIATTLFGEVRAEEILASSA
ncbi:hypothetical protein [Agrobacterium pusense]|uniref:hypothetical protein n=1 Tax=Agrobacterium pusense TaxID=648995 RepID=UPI0018E59C0A|nr:hypothetical protein [Agrobacterium pusense]